MLEVLYNDLRLDLKDARERDDSDDIEMIRGEMLKLKKQQQELTN